MQFGAGAFIESQRRPPVITGLDHEHEVPHENLRHAVNLRYIARRASDRALPSMSLLAELMAISCHGSYKDCAPPEPASGEQLGFSTNLFFLIVRRAGQRIWPKAGNGSSQLGAVGIEVLEPKPVAIFCGLLFRHFAAFCSTKICGCSRESPTPRRRFRPLKCPPFSYQNSLEPLRSVPYSPQPTGIILPPYSKARRPGALASIQPLAGR